MNRNINSLLLTVTLAVGGSIGLLGRAVPEAVYSKKGKPARNPLPR